jgi:hypothetical protein
MQDFPSPRPKVRQRAVEPATPRGDRGRHIRMDENIGPDGDNSQIL